jgi:hypothetical protein
VYPNRGDGGHVAFKVLKRAEGDRRAVLHQKRKMVDVVRQPLGPGDEGAGKGFTRTLTRPGEPPADVVASRKRRRQRREKRKAEKAAAATTSGQAEK